MPKSPDQPRIQLSQRGFRTRLAIQLFERSERLSGLPSSLKTSLATQVHPVVAHDHDGLERLGYKAKRCVVCLCAGRKVEKLAKARKPLAELSINARAVNASPWPPRKEIRWRSNTIETKIITPSSH